MCPLHLILNNFMEKDERGSGSKADNVIDEDESFSRSNLYLRGISGWTSHCSRGVRGTRTGPRMYTVQASQQTRPLSAASSTLPGWGFIGAEEEDANSRSCWIG